MLLLTCDAKKNYTQDSHYLVAVNFEVIVVR